MPGISVTGMTVLPLASNSVAPSRSAGRSRITRDGSEAVEFLHCEGAYAGRDPAQVPSLVVLDLKNGQPYGHWLWALAVVAPLSGLLRALDVLQYSFLARVLGHGPRLPELSPLGAARVEFVGLLQFQHACLRAALRFPDPAPAQRDNPRVETNRGYAG